MAYGSALVDTIQSSTANTPVVFKDGNGTQIGTLCRAWVDFNGTGTVAIYGSFNVSSITDNGTGDYTVNFTTAMPDTNYNSVGMGRHAAGSSDAGFVVCFQTADGTTGKTTSGMRISSHQSNSTLADSPYVSVSFFR